jgi:protein gp37
MASNTSIEWTQRTWNPVTGCTKVSAGCKNCYAERMAQRLKAMGLHQYKNGFQVTLAPAVLEEPLRWSKPRLVFVNSMSDLFHEDVPLQYVQRVFDIMSRTPQHTYQILTKRHVRLTEVAKHLVWPKNVWMGVSVENQATTNRIPHLLATDAHVKFLSIEPLIGEIRKLCLSGIDWVIVGGESGPGARTMAQAWVQRIQRACEKQRVPFFFKQWGRREFNSDENDPTISKIHPYHAKGGCQLNGRIYREMP